MHSDSPVQWPRPRGTPQDNLFPSADLETRLVYGELPGVVTAPKADRASILRAYAFVHLEEEMRREALIKDWASFVRFLRLAALESGQVLNYAAISNETGISQPIVKSYYQFLDDMSIGVRVLAWTKAPARTCSPRRNFFCSISAYSTRPRHWKFLARPYAAIPAHYSSNGWGVRRIEVVHAGIACKLEERELTGRDRAQQLAGLEYDALRAHAECGGAGSPGGALAPLRRSPSLADPSTTARQRSNRRFMKRLSAESSEELRASSSARTMASSTARPQP